MTVEELRALGAVYPEDIQQGFMEYAYEVRKSDQQQTYDTIRRKWEEGGKQNVYTDFYYFALSSDEREKVDQLLTGEEQEHLRELRRVMEQENRSVKEHIIFPLDEMLLQIVAKLNEADALYSTICILDENCAWWGNFGKEYVIFRKR